jgi:hypothetical protein
MSSSNFSSGFHSSNDTQFLDQKQGVDAFSGFLISSLGMDTDQDGVSSGMW